VAVLRVFGARIDALDMQTKVGSLLNRRVCSALELIPHRADVSQRNRADGCIEGSIYVGRIECPHAKHA
jgi:hypothetical protein